MADRQLNCVVYYTEPGTETILDLRVWAPRLLRIMGITNGGSPSECTWLIPTWDAFEQASV